MECLAFRGCTSPKPIKILLIVAVAGIVCLAAAPLRARALFYFAHLR